MLRMVKMDQMKYLTGAAVSHPTADKVLLKRVNCWAVIPPTDKKEILFYNDVMNPSMVRRLSKYNPDLVDKMFIFVTARDPSMPVDFHQTHEELWISAGYRIKAAGNRHLHLTFEADHHTIDWPGCSPWVITRTETELVHIYHCYLSDVAATTSFCV